MGFLPLTMSYYIVIVSDLFPRAWKFLKGTVSVFLFLAFLLRSTYDVGHTDESTNVC